MQAGGIRIDGVSIRRLRLAELRSLLAIVPQDPVIFAANAWDNIRIDRPDASDTAVRATAEAAHAAEFLDRLPDGFDTYLGEKGITLSGGQKQRIPSPAPCYVTRASCCWTRPPAPWMRRTSGWSRKPCST
ncbi:MAG: ATP-binding cassette domain-containing protein [Pseudomonadota bacterium]